MKDPKVYPGLLLGIFLGFFLGYIYKSTPVIPVLFHQPAPWVYWYTDDKIYRFRNVTNACSTNLYLLEMVYRKDLEPSEDILYYAE